MKLLIILGAAVLGVGFWLTYDHAMHVKKKADMGDLATQLAHELKTGDSSMLIFERATCTIDPTGSHRLRSPLEEKQWHTKGKTR